MRKRDNKKAILIITDGIGYNESCEYNAFCQAKNQLMITYLKIIQIHL